MKISCRFSQEKFNAGEIGAALVDIKGIIRTRDSLRSLLLSARCFGHLSAEPRWMHSGFAIKECVQPASATFQDQPISIPVPVSSPDTSSCACIFLTPEKQWTWSLPITESDQEEYVELGMVALFFYIPHHSIPSHRGMCSAMAYHVSVSVINAESGSVMSTHHFPFQVAGLGSIRVPYTPLYVHAQFTIV